MKSFKFDMVRFYVHIHKPSSAMEEDYKLYPYKKFRLYKIATTLSPHCDKLAFTCNNLDTTL